MDRRIAEPVLDHVHMRLVGRDLDALGPILADQLVRILAARPVPRRTRMRELQGQLRRAGELRVLRHVVVARAASACCVSSAAISPASRVPLLGARESGG